MKNNNNLPKAARTGGQGFAMPVIIAIVAVVLVLSGVIGYYFGYDVGFEREVSVKKAMLEKETMDQKEKDAMMDKKDDGAMMDEGDTTMKYSGMVLAGKSAPLLDFMKADYDVAVKTDQLVVLYFYANWCPICKAEFPVMQRVFNELGTDKVVGFRVNYNDNQTDNDEMNLAREFGVAYQHTKVFVKNGQRILKSPEGWDENRYDMEINKVLTQ